MHFGRMELAGWSLTLWSFTVFSFELYIPRSFSVAMIYNHLDLFIVFLGEGGLGCIHRGFSHIHKRARVDAFAHTHTRHYEEVSRPASSSRVGASIYAKILFFWLVLGGTNILVCFIFYFFFERCMAWHWVGKKWVWVSNYATYQCDRVDIPIDVVY